MNANRPRKKRNNTEKIGIATTNGGKNEYVRTTDQIMNKMQQSKASSTRRKKITKNTLFSAYNFLHHTIASTNYAAI